jgi:hypothetical protein
MINADRGAATPPPVDRPCWYCTHWAGPCWGDPYMADCHQGGRKSCVPNAGHGCVHWMRETGVDDDAWAPVAIVRPRSPTGKPMMSGDDLFRVVNQVQSQVDRAQSR